MINGWNFNKRPKCVTTNCIEDDRNIHENCKDDKTLKGITKKGIRFTVIVTNIDCAKPVKQPLD
jgi:hypothetical protein